MFTRADYWEYFEAIRVKEIAMIANLKQMIARLTDPAAVEGLSAILRDELRHADLVRELFDLL